MFLFFFFNDTATTEIYTLSLHDALPISAAGGVRADLRPHRALRAGVDESCHGDCVRPALRWTGACPHRGDGARSEEHTSELQSRLHLVCRLLLEKKKKKTNR